ncbi:DUF4302 domain-containing protein [Niabella sp. CJ426]|uniref:DUF4302 domain-containing protein n=1 Tax=Niabella sp. CJ426 TaxID=3393740 RepID=UPI003CFFD09E
MRKNIYNYLLLVVVATMILGSCQKNDLPLDGAQSKQRATALQKDILSALHDTNDGWVLMLQGLNANIRTAMPVLLKFDTLTGDVRTRTLFSKDVTSSKFLLSASTGVPLLSFSTFSFISQTYTAANTAITDFFFKVLEVSKDSITIQPLRKGNIYQSEGGALIKLYKASSARMKWASDLLNSTATGPNVFTQASLFGKDLEIRLKSTFAADSIRSRTYFDSWGTSITVVKNNQPITRTYPVLNPIVIEYYGAYPIAPTATPLNVNTIVGEGLIYWQPTTALTPAEYFITGPNAIINFLKTDYLLVKSVTANSVEVYAVDANGNICISGTIGL